MILKAEKLIYLVVNYDFIFQALTINFTEFTIKYNRYTIYCYLSYDNACSTHNQGYP